METEKLFEFMTKMYSDFTKRFDSMDNRLTGVEDRLIGVEGRLTGVEGRLTNLENTVLRIEHNHGQKLDALFDGYKQNSIQLERIEEKVSKHEDIILRKIK